MIKKIMFNDSYSLTQAVLEGRKTQTRRIITHPKTFHGKDVCGFYVYKRATDGVATEVCMYDEDEIPIDEGQILPKYKVGEVVAVAQSYKDTVNTVDWVSVKLYESTPGWNNKLFTRASEMPHQIRITNVRIQRLQDISDEDCLKEGLEWDGKASQYYTGYMKETGGRKWFGSTPREAFAHLINKVSRKDVWNENPYVFVYDFELFK